MAFQAYPTPSSQQGRSASALWQVQGALHGGESLLVPGALLLAATGFVVYEHFSSTHGYDTNRNFLAMILVTMLPLAFLEKKVFACADPLRVMSQFSGKVLLSHACFLVMRVPQHYMHDGVLSVNFAYCITGLLSACVLLPTCFHVRSARAAFQQNWDVWTVVMLGLVAAVATEGFNAYFDSSPVSFWGPPSVEERRWALLKHSVETASLYIELLAFVPATWMVCRVGKGSQPQEEATSVADTRIRALALFTFLVGFYFLEDVLSAFMLCRMMPLAALAHLAHFGLLLDFCFYLLSHLYDPAKLGKLTGAFRDMFAEACAV